MNSRRPVLFDGRFDQRDHVAGLERTVRPQHVALPRVFVQHGQHPQGTATHRGVRNEVPGPDMPAMRRLRRQPRRVAPAGHPAFRRRHPQAFLPSQSLHLALAHLKGP